MAGCRWSAEGSTFRFGVELCRTAGQIGKKAHACPWPPRPRQDRKFAEDKCATVALLPPASRPAVSALFFQRGPEKGPNRNTRKPLRAAVAA